MDKAMDEASSVRARISRFALFGLFVASLAASSCLDPIVSYPCAPGRTACGEMCLDLNNDPANCGGCGQVCGSGFCQAGICVDPPDGGTDADQPDGLGGDSGQGGDGGGGRGGDGG